AFAVLFHTLIFDSILVFSVLRIMNLPLMLFIKNIFPAIKSVVGMTILYFIFQFLLPTEGGTPIFSLIFNTFIGIVCYMLMTAIFNKEVIFQFMRNKLTVFKY